MRKIFSIYTKIILLTFILAIFSIFNINKAMADQIKLTLKEVGAGENVELKTVKTFRNFYFTRPKAWNMSPSSKIVLTFQHSPQLLPERSSLNILINDQSIKTIELGKNNAQSNTVTIPIPVNILKDHNKLTFDVDQHYTYQCEDPFDPSLWTTVLNTSVIQLDYTKMIPETDFALFPYPFFDDLEYAPAGLNYVLPKPDPDSDDTLKALAMVNTSISQYIGWKDLNVMVYTPDKINEKTNLIIVGTPRENEILSIWNQDLPYKIRDGKFVDPSGTTIDDDFGILMLVPNPKHTGSALLIVSGNTPKAVFKAAKALTQNPTKEIFKGTTVLVKETLPNELAELRDWPEYVRTKEVRLIDLKMDSKTTRGVTSVPIKYDLKIMPDMSMPPRNFVKMNLVYSYAANIDPDMSKLEVILNGTSVHSAKLTNTDGENLANLEIEIPTEAFEIYNDLRFQFYLFPIKYDTCRFTTDAHIWGTIHNITKMNFPVQIKTVIPNVDLINDGGYPFNAYRDLQDTIFVLANDYNATDVYGMLWVLARLGKMAHPTDAMNLNVVRYKNLKVEDRNSKNIIAIGTDNRNKLIEDAKPELNLIYNKEGFKFLKQDKIEKMAGLKDDPEQGIIEQLLSPWETNRVLMILYGKDNKGLLNAISLFSDSTKFKNIKKSNIVAVKGKTVQSVVTLRKDQAKLLHGENVKREAETFDFWWKLFKIFLMVVGAIAVLRIIFGAFVKGGIRP